MHTESALRLASAWVWTRSWPWDADALAQVLGGLANLLEGGMPLSESVQSLAEFERGSALQARLNKLALQLEQGSSLSTSMLEAGLTTRPEVIAILAAAERDGTLADACRALEQRLNRQIKHGQQLRTALVYPVVSALCLVLATLFLLWQVVPSVSGSGAFAADVAWHAQPLLWLSSALRSQPSLVVGIGLCAGLGAVILCGQIRRGHLPRRLSVSSHCHRLFQLADYADVLRRLRLHGAPLELSMHSAEACIASAPLRQQLILARHQVRVGSALSASLADASLVPPPLVRLLAVGESSGSLDQSLLYISRLLSVDAQRKLERQRELAPVILLLLVGGVMLWIIVSVLLPVYQQALNSVLGA